MSKVFIISNTNFNISKNISSKEWLKIMDYYYYNEFIPYLENNFSPNDVLIHLGNLLYKNKNIDLNILKFVQELFEKISNIIPVYIIEGENDSLSLNILKNINNIQIIKKSTEIELLLDQRFSILPNLNIDDLYNFESDYCFFNFDILNSPNKDVLVNILKKFKKCYNGYYDKNGVISNIKNLGSPYNIDGDEKKGFIVLETHTNKDKFIQNKTSPNFKNIKLNSIEDINNFNNISKSDYINISINKKLFIDNKLKLEMLMTDYNISNINYIDDDIIKDKEDIIELEESSLTLKDMVVDYIEKSDYADKNKILKKFENILELNKK
jgi:hypothetical protein